ncbi:AAA family ATPase [Brachybacterium sp. NBEC-018]|uniref:RNA polymerase recycling motor ATPase HelR n=1 Tax=Brachybacterium sp. NBEC-018 TaxID=2996004 RepID=UPI00217522ED|nr:RNA polymerase recycling motor ATPase HelR [Brachybacterium sp. NBEC-018]UVY82772.1 AAA family ATPase [Brachybacterium sp. NBEC-018]
MNQPSTDRSSTDRSSLDGPLADEQHLAAARDELDRQVRVLRDRLDAVLAGRGAGEQGRLERDEIAEHLRSRLRGLAAVSGDLVLGRMDLAGGGSLHVGRIGVSGQGGRPLLVDWRSEAARPFFAATRAEPLGLVSRRRYRWSGGQVTAFWDELLDPAATPPSDLRPDGESALLASLGRARGPRMRDVLTTLAADQDAIIRADPRRPLVVDGGPGTGKTVVALHRAAYLLHHDPRLRTGRAGILVVGPSRPYLDYVADVLPNLGEDVLTATPADLVPEGETAQACADPELAALLADARLLDAVDARVAIDEQPPRTTVVVDTAAGELTIGPAEWSAAFAAVDPGTAHDHARDAVREELAEILAERLDEERTVDDTDVDDADGGEDGPSAEELLPELLADDELTATLEEAWPLLDPVQVVRDLLGDPELLRRCAPWLDATQAARLQLPHGAPWALEHLPLLDAARRRIGDPEREARAERRARAVARDSSRMDEVVADLVADDPTEMRQMSMLRGQDLRGALDAQVVTEAAPVDPFEGPFAHLVVDEAQELTDAQWRMLLARCPSHRVTIVGDRAQAVAGFAESWGERLARVGLPRVDVATLHLNYRTPAEIMEVAAEQIREAVPGASVPESVRRTGRPVREAGLAGLEQVLRAWQERRAGDRAADGEPLGTACVIAPEHLELPMPPSAPEGRIVRLTPELAKGLEFDLVVLADPDGLGDGVAGAVSRYVAMTRATADLVVLRP